MPNSDSLSVIAQGQLIQTVDTGRAATDRFKMLAADRTLFDSRLADLTQKDNDTALTESNRAGGSGKARDALNQLNVLLRDGYKGIAGIRSSTISDAQRLEVFTAYGWASGKLGELGDARVLGLARLALSSDLNIEKPEWEYAAALKTEIAAQLAIFDANADDRTGGDRMEATKARNTALDLFLTMLSRCRHFLCSASDDIDNRRNCAAADSRSARIGPRNRPRRPLRPRLRPRSRPRNFSQVVARKGVPLKPPLVRATTRFENSLGGI
ncbi:MAG: hypothetical protein H0X40_07260 [Chthoniobacterales bacterium]|nr:hypothetical protein [Chthoniobacterales bacterium]